MERSCSTDEKIISTAVPIKKSNTCDARSDVIGPRKASAIVSVREATHMTALCFHGKWKSMFTPTPDSRNAAAHEVSNDASFGHEK